MYENLVGLNVTDDEEYDKYRNAMLPILTAMGGGFRYDLRVETMLRSDAEHPINRVFIIYFPSKAVMTKFFANDDYLLIRKRHFEAAVDGVTRMAEYSVDPIQR